MSLLILFPSPGIYEVLLICTVSYDTAEAALLVMVNVICFNNNATNMKYVIWLPHLSSLNKQ